MGNVKIYLVSGKELFLERDLNLYIVVFLPCNCFKVPGHWVRLKVPERSQGGGLFIVFLID